MVYPVDFGIKKVKSNPVDFDVIRHSRWVL